MMRTVVSQGILLACLALLLAASHVQATTVALMPIWHRVALAECVVVGKVTAIENKTVLAPASANAPQKEEYRVAVVKIGKGFTGAKSLTDIRVAAPIPRPPQPGQPVIAGGEILLPVPLKVGQETCLFLTRHFKEPFFIAPRSYELINKQDNVNYDKQVALIERCCKLLETPVAGLKAKDPEDRLLTAAMLLTRYRTPKLGVANPKTEPIDAEQNKLILETLSQADWTKDYADTNLSAQWAFMALRLTVQDGWTQPGDGREILAAARKWLKDKAATYRIQRFVIEDGGRK